MRLSSFSQVLAVPLFLAVAGCGSDSGPVEIADAIPAARLLSRGGVATVTRADVTTGPAINGVLMPSLVVEMKAKIPGDILTVAVQEGAIVRKGQSLATMDTNELQYQLKSAEAEFAAAEAASKNARQHWERSKRLAGEGAIAPRDVDVAQAEADAATAQVSLRLARAHEIRKIIADARFPSPLDGVVSKRFVNAGDRVDDGDVVLTVVDPRVIELTAAISSEDLGRVKVGLPISSRVEGYQNRTFEGVVARINPGADPVTRQVTVYVRLPNEKGELIGGLFATGRIITEKAEAALTVPSDALRSESGGSVVYRIDKGTATTVPVTVLLKDETTGRIAVSGPLAEGDVILVGPTTDLTSGSKVTLPTTDSTERR